MYETEREKLISEFYKEAYDRDALLDSRKQNFANFIHAATTQTKSRMLQTEENLINGRVDIKADSFIKREEQTNKSERREAVACWEIRNIINVFNRELWPKDRMKDYQQTLEKDVKADKFIKDLEKKEEKAETEIEDLTEELKTLTNEQLSKETNLKSELQFMTKLLRTGEQKSKIEESSDFEKIKHLVKVCDKTKKLLKEKVEKIKKIETTMKLCGKFEKLRDELEVFDDFGSSEKLMNELESSENFDIESCDGKIVNFESSDDFESFQSFYKSKITEDTSENFTKNFFKKLSKVEADCVMLRQYKEQQLKQRDELMSEIKETKHQLAVQRNLRMLRLSTTPSVGEICQISHQIPQIKTPVKMQKNHKLCKSCRNFYGNL
jgi:hypothetical protein